MRRGSGDEAAAASGAWTSGRGARRAIPFAAAPSPGTVREVAPGVLWARFPLPYRLNHVNVYLLEDDGGWAILDTATDGAANRDLWTRLLEDGPDGRPVTRIIASHFHPDHLGAAGWLVRRTGAPLLMSRPEHELALAMESEPLERYFRRNRIYYLRHGMPRDEVEASVGVDNAYATNISPIPRSSHYLAEGDTLDVGGRTFRVLTGSGHSPSLVMLHDPADGLLLCSDQVLARISPNISVMSAVPDANPLAAYIASLAALRRSVPDDVLVLPGHELPFRGLHVRIDELTVHHEARCEAIASACRTEAITVRRLVPHIFGRDFSGTTLLNAVGEAVAHVNLMLADGRLAAFENDSVLHFRTV